MKEREQNTGRGSHGWEAREREQGRGGPEGEGHPHNAHRLVLRQPGPRSEGRMPALFT